MWDDAVRAVTGVTETTHFRSNAASDVPLEKEDLPAGTPSAGTSLALLNVHSAPCRANVWTETARAWHEHGNRIEWMLCIVGGAASGR